jgi:hypothetical protein
MAGAVLANAFHELGGHIRRFVARVQSENRRAGPPGLAERGYAHGQHSLRRILAQRSAIVEQERASGLTVTCVARARANAFSYALPRGRLPGAITSPENCACHHALLAPAGALRLAGCQHGGPLSSPVPGASWRFPHALYSTCGPSCHWQNAAAASRFIHWPLWRASRTAHTPHKITP